MTQHIVTDVVKLNTSKRTELPKQTNGNLESLELFHLICSNQRSTAQRTLQNQISDSKVGIVLAISIDPGTPTYAGHNAKLYIKCHTKSLGRGNQAQLCGQFAHQDVL